MYKKILFLVLAVLVAIVAFKFSAKSDKKTNDQSLKPQETNKVRITTMPVVQGLPFYLAMEKGYFKDAGLEIEFVKFESPNQIIDAIMQGKVDFTPPSAATGVIAIADTKNPGKMKIYSLGGGDLEVQNDAILIKKTSLIKSMKDLKGKKLGIVAGSAQWKAFALEILAINNLTPDKDVMLVELALGLQPQALESGQVDALLTVEPVPTLITDKDLGKELVDHAAAKFIANPFYSGAGVISTDFASKNPETTKKVLAVFKKAVDEVNSNPEEARQYLKGYTSLDGNMIAKVPISRFKMVDDFTQEDITAVNKILDLLPKYKLIEKENSDFEKLIYSAS